MRDRKLFALGFTTFSVLMAVGVLIVLLLIATARTPDQLRLINANTEYLQQAVVSISRGIEVSSAQHQALGEDVLKLDQALVQGSIGLSEVLLETYRPVSLLESVRWSVISWLNVIDADAGVLNSPADLIASETAVQTSVAVMREQFVRYGATQLDLFAAKDSYDADAQELVGMFRQKGQQRHADTIYVNTEQAKILLRTGHSAELDGVLEVIDQLERVEEALPAAERSRLRILINATYTMISLKRAMNQAAIAMDQDKLTAQLDGLADLATNDQIYVLGAVNDARVLLNIYTVLLLLVLASFGLRLRASHRALNRSHDDLELRVEERTADLALANQDLKESQVQLVQAEKMSSLGQLVAGVMHEINTPLLYVLNNTSVSAESVRELSDYVEATAPILTAENSEDGKQAIRQLLSRRDEFDVVDLVENIQEVESLAVDSIDGLNQISELVQSLKDFSRLDRVSEDVFDVREGLEKTLTITRNLLKQGVEVKKDFKEVPKISCSPSRLNQVFINLVTNAVQAMDGKGVLSISTSHNQTSKGDCVEIVFQDTGCGIAEEDLGRIMDPFFTTKPVGEGTGLGLSIVHQIVEQHGGQMIFDSKVGHGTRIMLSFPVDGPDRSAAVTDAEEAA